MGTPSESISGGFSKLDQAIYGKLKGVTDKEEYTSSFQVPENCKISIENRMKIEASYHALTNGGHITYAKLDKKVTDSTEEMMKIVHMMKEAGIGYGAILSNKEVD